MTLASNQTITGQKTFSNNITIDGSLTMSGNGSLKFPRAPINGAGNQYSTYHCISAGSGYSTTSGDNGMKLICCDQTDAATGMGQDLGKGTTIANTPAWNYDTWLVGGKNGDAATNGYISFGFHTYHNTDYDRVSYINAIGDFYTRGNIYSNNKKAVTLASDGTANYIPKFTDINTIGNSNITDDGTIITLGKSTIIKASSSNYREGLRILPIADDGWALTFYSANASSTAGTNDGGWLVGRRGADGTIAGKKGDFTIEEQNSNGANLTIHKDCGGATLIGPLTLRNTDTTKTTKATFEYNAIDKCIDVTFT